jgi:hypothetical protein
LNYSDRDWPYISRTHPANALISVQIIIPKACSCKEQPNNNHYAFAVPLALTFLSPLRIRDANHFLSHQSISDHLLSISYIIPFSCHCKSFAPVLPACADLTSLLLPLSTTHFPFHLKCILNSTTPTGNHTPSSTARSPLDLHFLDLTTHMARLPDFSNFLSPSDQLRHSELTTHPPNRNPPTLTRREIPPRSSPSTVSPHMTSGTSSLPRTSFNTASFRFA